MKPTLPFLLLCFLPGALFALPSVRAGDDAAWFRLRREVEALNHIFFAECPLGPIRCYASNQHTDRRKAAVDRRIQHVNAQVILREVRPERVEREIGSIYRELCRIGIADRHKRAREARLWGF